MTLGASNEAPRGRGGFTSLWSLSGPIPVRVKGGGSPVNCSRARAGKSFVRALGQWALAG